MSNANCSKPSSPQPTIKQRRLTRQGRLRYLSDKDAALHSTTSLPASPLPSFKSGSSSDHWSSSAVPQPLPRPDSPLTRRYDHHQLGSPPFEHPGFAFRRSVDHDAVRSIRSTSNLGRPFFDPVASNAKHDLRVNIPPARVLAGNSSSCKDHTERSQDNDSENVSDLRLHFSAKSAPNSIFSSPVTSPRRSSNVDFYDPSIIFHHDFNDILRVSPVKTAQSPDRTPLRSPGSLLNPEGCQSQLHKHSSRVLPENSHVDAHPLPLPPRASPPPAQSPPQHQPSIVHLTVDNSPSMKGQWQKGKLIGRGSYGSVYHATNLYSRAFLLRHRETGASCAMKEVEMFPDDPKSADCIKQLEQEIRILRQLHHPNIVQYYGSELDGDRLYIYMEYVHPGSLDKFMHDHCGAMTESVVRNFTRHILSGLAYLHSTKTIHRDIKGANLLVDATGMVKLADFGVSKILTEKSYELSLKGSPYWMAPELMKAAIKKESSPDVAMAIDIWSLGCTIIEMLTGKPPWREYEGPQAMFKVLHKSPKIPENLSSDGQDFLQQCFRRNPADRPSAALLLTHAFVQNLHDQDALHSQGQSCPRGDPGSGDDSSRHSPANSSRSNNRGVPASIGARFLHKIQNLIGDTSKKYDSEESDHVTSSRSSPCSMTEINSPQSSALNYMANSSNIPLTTVMRIIRHI
ncbi:mitogen-activated protein kinase kinase kinase 5 isoform X2 [Vigna radiata var. radiata]|uniref:mitogen-activated protein kinase kinase kinase n=1 Tax=Vigna radiata var. radiata TaxID=3916 RepID=A0A3Q0EY70_VIGRR|nr:mitogen-activated protein kinase kinase kinase 5 isoform X2 [Vigna radiata var. radiata]